MFADRNFSCETTQQNSDEESGGSDGDESQMSGFQYPSHSCDISPNRSEYVTHICTSGVSDPDVAIALSDGRLEVLNMSDKAFNNSYQLNNNTKRIVEMKFDNNNYNLLWVADHNGIINLWDIRNPTKTSLTFTDTTDDKTDKDKKFNSFDVSSCGRLLCAGTDKFEDDSYLLFWDIRKNSLAGGFWESHTDDITQVKFHPNESSKFFSASTDGLINVYDLEHSCEEDALVDTLNTETSIEKLCFGAFRNKNIISCISHTADVQFWKLEDVQPYATFKRDQITTLLQKKSEEYSYIVDAHKYEDSFLVVAGGTKNDGKLVRVFKLNDKILEPFLALQANKQRVLCSSYNEKAKLLVTGGEKGTVDIWRLSH